MKYYKFLVLLILVPLYGCGSPADLPAESSSATPVAEKTPVAFSLEVLDAPQKVNEINSDLFVEVVPEPEPVASFELVKLYEDYEVVKFESVKGTAPFALFFTAENCDRCQNLERFFNRNLGAMPNGTQILQAEWGVYPNLQTELKAARPGTIVFFGADGEVEEVLFAPPIDRVTDFFAKI